MGNICRKTIFLGLKKIKKKNDIILFLTWGYSHMFDSVMIRLNFKLIFGYSLFFTSLLLKTCLLNFYWANYYRISGEPHSCIKYIVIYLSSLFLRFPLNLDQNTKKKTKLLINLKWPNVFKSKVKAQMLDSIFFWVGNWFCNELYLA